MYKFYLLMCSVLCVSGSLFSTTLDIKQKKLLHLQDQIEENNVYIESVKRQKIKVQNDKDNYKKSIKKSNASLKKLAKQDKYLKNKLKKSQKTLEFLTKNENEQKSKCISIYHTLFFVDKKLNEKDKVLFAELLKSNLDSLKVIEFDIKLEKLKEKKNKKLFNNILEKKKIYTNKMKKYKNNISKIDKEIVDLDRRNLDYKLTLIELESRASEIKKIIKNFEKCNIKNEFSFQFSSSHLNWPVNGEIVTDYGMHKFENASKLEIWNNGIDFKVKNNCKIKSIDKGIVAYATWFDSWGKVIIIDHQNGFQSLYANNSNLLVSKGDKVIKGQIIAKSGSIDNKKNIIHFELRKNGRPIDPKPFFIKKELTCTEY